MSKSETKCGGRARFPAPPGDGPVAGHLAGTGAIAEFERKLRSHFGARHALCVSSATAGLLAIALALELRDRAFITTPITYGGTIASWLMLGNGPVFVDVDDRDLTLSPLRVARAIVPDIAAILSVDAFGNPADSKSLRRIADEHGVWYIADAAQSFGGRRDGSPASRWAHALVVSFTSGKTLDAGEGGAIVTDDPEIYERLLWVCQHPFRQKRELGLGGMNEFGFNARINPYAAAAGSERFEWALSVLAARQNLRRPLLRRLEEQGVIRSTGLTDGTIDPTFFRTIVDPEAGPAPERVTAVLRSLRVNGRIVAPGDRPIYSNPTFLRDYGAQHRVPEACPVADAFAGRLELRFGDEAPGRAR